MRGHPGFISGVCPAFGPPFRACGKTSVFIRHDGHVATDLIALRDLLRLLIGIHRMLRYHIVLIRIKQNPLQIWSTLFMAASSMFCFYVYANPKNDHILCIPIRNTLFNAHTNLLIADIRNK